MQTETMQRFFVRIHYHDPSSRLPNLAFLRSFTEVLHLDNKLEIECSSTILCDDFFAESLFYGAHSCLVQKHPLTFKTVSDTQQRYLTDDYRQRGNLETSS